MANPKVLAAATAEWTDVIGAAAAVPGVTWQCIGDGVLAIAFTVAEPTLTDAVHELGPREAFYDKNGSAHCWIRLTGRGAASISATAD